MLSECSEFNQEVVIPNGVETCSNMFYNCTELTDLCIHLTQLNTAHVCLNSAKFNQPINVPKSATVCNRMFKKCSVCNDT